MNGTKKHFEGVYTSPDAKMYSSDANEASPRGFVKPSEKSSENEGSILANEFTISPHYVSE